MPDQQAQPPISKHVEEKKPSSYINLLHIALDTYDDIFSDFDPSNYGKRLLSDDFLKEMQKRYVETKRGEFEVRFSIPEVMRSIKTEALIKKRLSEYFLDHMRRLDGEVKGQRRIGNTFFFVGALVLIFTLYIAENSQNSNTGQIVGILLTPLGWFGMWEGLGIIVKAGEEHAQELRFYRKFSRANYVFMSEEEFVAQLGAKTDEKIEAQKKA